MQRAEAIFQEIEENFNALRLATESRHYRAFDGLLERQQELYRSAPLSDPRTPEMVLRGRELIHWAITMTKIQRASYARSLAHVLKSKHLESYNAQDRGADLISLSA